MLTVEPRRQVAKGGLKTAYPIRDPKDDRLGRWPFAQTIAKIVRGAPTDSPIVISVEGPWGSGKSSVLQMAATDLARDPRNRVITISAWRTSSQDQFLANLGYSLATALKRDWQYTSLRLGWARLSRQSLPLLVAVWVPLFTIAAIWLLPGVRAAIKPIVDASPEKLAAGLGLFGIPFLSFLFSKLSQPVASSMAGLFGKESDTDYIGSMEAFSFDFDVLAAAQPKGSRFVVLIEDLDRCVPARVTDVLSSIAQISSHEKSGRLAFLLAYDRTSMLESIGKDAVAHLKNDQRDDDAMALLSVDYLNRVVQLELPLPPESRNAQKPAHLLPRPFRCPVILRAAFVGSLVVASGLALVGPATIRAVCVAVCIIVVVCLVSEWAYLRAFVEQLKLDDLSDWDEAVSWADPWLPALERDRNRVLNGARVALALHREMTITPWQAISVRALAEKYPESFDAPSLAAAAAGAGLQSATPFMNAAITDAIKRMTASGRPVDHFNDASRLHAIVSSLKR